VLPLLFVYHGPTASVGARNPFAGALPWGTATAPSAASRRRGCCCYCSAASVPVPVPVILQGRKVYLLPRRPRGRPLDSPRFRAELLRLQELHDNARDMAAPSTISAAVPGSVEAATADAAIVGCDEAGAGCLAGPVVAAAVVLPEGTLFEGLDDSKRVIAVRRAEVLANLEACTGVLWAVGIVDAHTVDAINIRQARLLAMRQAVDALLQTLTEQHQSLFLIVDGTDALPGAAIPLRRQRAVVGADALCAAVAAASIIAKETRDDIMRVAHQQYPRYGFDAHKGYGTAQHVAALMQHGPCPLHRLSYKPVALAGQLHPQAGKPKL
jgi:ribonuclease HII